MGMSSSQSRFLALTSNLHNVEFKAQNIMSQKLQLATQRDEAFTAYCDALDAKKIQIACVGSNGKNNYIDATYTSVARYSETQLKQYALRDAKTNKVIVDKSVAEAYNNNSDKYSFAWECIMKDAARQSTFEDYNPDDIFKVNPNGAEDLS